MERCMSSHKSHQSHLWIVLYIQFACFWTVLRNQSFLSYLTQTEKNMQTPHRKPRVYPGIKPRTFCYEVKVLLCDPFLPCINLL